MSICEKTGPRTTVFFIKSEPGTRDGSDLAKNGRHFSPFPERGHTDFSLFTSKSVCPRNLQNGEFRGFSQEKISGIELKQRIRRTYA